MHKTLDSILHTTNKYNQPNKKLSVCSMYLLLPRHHCSGLSPSEVSHICVFRSMWSCIGTLAILRSGPTQQSWSPMRALCVHTYPCRKEYWHHLACSHNQTKDLECWNIIQAWKSRVTGEISGYLPVSLRNKTCTNTVQPSTSVTPGCQ